MSKKKLPTEVAEILARMTGKESIELPFICNKCGKTFSLTLYRMPTVPGKTRRLMVKDFKDFAGKNINSCPDCEKEKKDGRRT